MGSSGFSSCAEPKLYVRRTEDKINMGTAISGSDVSRLSLYVARDWLMCESA